MGIPFKAVGTVNKVLGFVKNETSILKVPMVVELIKDVPTDPIAKRVRKIILSTLKKDREASFKTLINYIADEDPSLLFAIVDDNKANERKVKSTITDDELDTIIDAI